jgi:hypothetical protein
VDFCRGIIVEIEDKLSIDIVIDDWEPGLGKLESPMLTVTFSIEKNLNEVNN